jgi:uncharacterized protein
MKPGDHPEFYRFPAPAGRSRESSIVLDAEGRFWHDGELLAHPGMARAFASWIARHPDDGRFILTNQFDWTYFTVEDVPFFVRGLRNAGGVPLLTLSDGSEEPLAADTLASDARGALYCRVKRGQFEARFTPEVQTLLAPWLVERADGEICVRVDEGEYAVGKR